MPWTDRVAGVETHGKPFREMMGFMGFHIELLVDRSVT